ncbi:Catenin alpha-2 [Ameca splendens]|uniref:Catenin alpha-2 n=2 Tax=Goodeidae TaxID=28758 RepID=A0ABV0Z992_9TELE
MGQQRVPQFDKRERVSPGTGRKEKGDPLNSAIDKMTKKTRDLRRQLRKAVMDHISDSFLETNVPLLVLIEAAKSGNEKEVKEYAQVFREHANKLVEVSYGVNYLTQKSFLLPWLTM